jgi:hypothetical protein
MGRPAKNPADCEPIDEPPEDHRAEDDAFQGALRRAFGRGLEKLASASAQVAESQASVVYVCRAVNHSCHGSPGGLCADAA